MLTAAQFTLSGPIAAPPGAINTRRDLTPASTGKASANTDHYRPQLGETLATIPPHPPVTNDELIKHRLKELEDFATGARQTERAVDGLNLAIAALEGSVTKLSTVMEKNDDHTRASLARLHERLDEITTAESFEKGREAGTIAASTRTWKVIAFSITATLMALGIIVALLNLLLN